MKLYNTLTKQVDDFKPLEDQQVRMYTCGPTVYDHIHVGNLSSFIYADTLRRVLAAEGYQIKHVMNYTDVDDKTIRRSREEFPDEEPDVALCNLTQKYEDLFVRDMQTIGNDTENVDFIKATQQIDDMKFLISKLYRDGFAYVTDDGIYFSIAKYRESGKNYGQLLEITDSNTSEARISNDEYDKDYVHDFALWKKRKADEPAWPFEIEGHDLLGRPGWHIECSAMSRKELGQPFDIHTGGVDLIFPHHENEIAQSTAGEENPVFATTFFHNEHLLIDGKKMSKSLNNFYTLEDIKEKGFNLTSFRLMVLQSHYRNQSNFTWDNLSAAQNRLNTYKAMAAHKWQPNEAGKVTEEDFTKARDEILAAMATDINTAEALAVLSRIAKLVDDGGVKPEIQNALDEFITFVNELFSLNLSDQLDISDDQKAIVAERTRLRDEQKWDEADALRKQLEEQKIGLNDTPNGPIWYRL